MCAKGGFAVRNTFVFATIVCVVCSVLLSLAANLLRPRQTYNVEIDRKKNVLVALGLHNPARKIAPQDVEALYKEKIAELVINSETGEVVEGKTIDELEEGSKLLPLYKRIDNDYIALPVEGMGLWSLLQGFFALKDDYNTVVGITFYEQKETPGLGAEITSEWFTNNFVGKEILNDAGELTSVIVAKGKAADMSSMNIKNVVDGISGATMTGRGVTDLLKEGVETYKPYLSKKWPES